jgi:hypothetical protein
MRLTLRTLLAYLDNTLDPQDAETLQKKLAESGFATQLVQRIRAMLANQTLPSPSPEAMGPVEEANVISEYLDSTLPAEQVAEIERACLESDPHLAEAAACHQILTMVLGEPAEVPAELRNRIYELPDRNIQDIAATSGTFSAVTIPTEQTSLGFEDSIPTTTVPTLDSLPVSPVGVSDSGVSDAPTRLRESGSVADVESERAAIAGSRPRSVDRDTMIYGGSIRPSRITPWLVSLGLAGVLLFALTRIFAPLINRDRVATNDETKLQVVDSPPETTVPEIVDIPVPEGTIDEGTTEEVTEALPEEEMVEMPMPDLPAPSTSTEVASRTPAMDAIRALEADSSAVTDSETVATDAAVVESPATPVPGDTVEEPASDATPEPEMSAAEAVNPPTAVEVAPVKPDVNAVGQLSGANTLVSAKMGDQWVRLKADSPIGSGVRICCAPSFRAEITTPEKIKVTLVGPVQIQWLEEDGQLVLHVEHGRILLTALEPDTQVRVRLGEETITMSFVEAQTVAAASVTHFRAPGFDPLIADNRIPLSGILSVQGLVALEIAGQSQSLNTRQQWVKRGDTEPQNSDVESVPKWVEVEGETDALVASACEGLLELLKADQPLDLALREASLFRRSEVASLAAQTMLNMGLGDVYFNGTGILSEPKQKTYWTDHYKALLAAVDRSAESAEQLQQSIISMDSANAASIFRLLTGYSQDQLKQGGDEELVKLLDSSSMPVRVLALENLRRITGTTLYFRPDQESSARRSKEIKKWEARLRKEDIRWSE